MLILLRNVSTRPAEHGFPNGKDPLGLCKEIKTKELSSLFHHVRVSQHILLGEIPVGEHNDNMNTIGILPKNFRDVQRIRLLAMQVKESIQIISETRSAVVSPTPLQNPIFSLYTFISNFRPGVKQLNGRLEHGSEHDQPMGSRLSKLQERN
nr:hypothetical protein Iba_chr09bCG6000 [Ipomoea batatas]